MSEKQDPQNKPKSENSRRKAIKGILGGAGAVAGSQALSEGWVKPVVSTAVMPAHAMVSANVITEVSARFEGSDDSGFETNYEIETDFTGIPDGTYEVFLNVDSITGSGFVTDSNTEDGSEVEIEDGSVSSSEFEFGGAAELANVETLGSDILVELVSEVGDFGDGTGTILNESGN